MVCSSVRDLCRPVVRRRHCLVVGMVHWDMYINTGKVLFRLVRNIYIHYYYLYPTDQSLCRVFLSCQGLGGISTGFGTGCELSWVDNLFETVTSLAWEVSPIRPPSTQGRQYPGYTISLVAACGVALHLLPPMINGTLA